MLKQVTIENENAQLKHQLQNILKNAHENEEKLKRFEQIEFKLMEANSLIDLLDVLILDYPSLFNLNFSTLILVDSNSSIKPLLTDKTIKNNYANRVSILDLPFSIEKIIPLSKKMFLGDYQIRTHKLLIDPVRKNHKNIKSIAILPLLRHGEIIGIFSCVSTQKNRFEPDSGTIFMKRLSYIISVCIENVLNYERLKLCSLTDPLTKIRNRRFFDQSLIEEVTRVQRTQLPLSCLLIDIDHFKRVNDKYGHSAGDEVLVQVVKRIQKTLRSHEILARYGGEEFVLILPKTENTEALKVASRIISTVNTTPIAIDDKQELTITISIGLSTLYKEFNSEDINFYGLTLIEHSDQALYQAKETGRNKVCNNGFC
ncbi:MAG: sensor domain-containing diguanylate cyclase [Pseudomonadota bacterium]